MMNEIPKPPPSWYNLELMSKQVHLELDLLTLISIHGAIVLAVKHPEIGQYVGPHLESCLSVIEAGFQEVGLEEPQYGWRGMIDGEAGTDRDPAAL